MSLEQERRDALDRRATDLVSEFDATVWTKVWLETLAEHPTIPTDRGDDARLVRERVDGGL